MEMDERKMKILQAIIDDYILTGVPVGSRTISKKYDMGLSSATIRNEMSDLEELGYLDQPHVSAGRIPSAKAYRLYVDSLMKTGQIRDDSLESISRHFTGRVSQIEDVIDHAASIISALTRYTAVVLPPKGKQPRMQTVQLVPVSRDAALVVIVTDTGIVRDSTIRIPAEMDSDTLYNISRALTEELGDEYDFAVMQSVNERLSTLIREHKEEKIPEPLAVGSGVVGEMLTDCGVSDKAVKAFADRCREELGEGASIRPENVIDTKRFTIRAEEVTVAIAPEQSFRLETRIIDGRKCLVIPVGSSVEINGVETKV